MSATANHLHYVISKANNNSDRQKLKANNDALKQMLYNAFKHDSHAVLPGSVWNPYRIYTASVRIAVAKNDRAQAEKTRNQFLPEVVDFTTLSRNL